MSLNATYIKVTGHRITVDVNAIKSIKRITESVEYLSTFGLARLESTADVNTPERIVLTKIDTPTMKYIIVKMVVITALTPLAPDPFLQKTYYLPALDSHHIFFA